MNCSARWDRGTLFSLFTQAFIRNEYKQHREKYLLDREKALLPDTQIRLEQRKKLRDKEDEIAEVRQQIRDLRTRLSDLYIERHNITQIIDGDEEIEEKKTFVRGCPADDCRGFLSTAWVCGMCSVKVCSKCHEIKSGKKHTCDPEHVATAEFLSKDTRPCPKCGTRIHKIEGCDQMFCTQCKTAFSWKTGRIETSVIHNPHYYEWQREQAEKNGTTMPRANGDVPCGGELDVWVMNPLLKDLKPYIKFTHDILHVMQVFSHHRHVTLRSMGYVYNYRDNLDLRFRFLENRITPEKFGQLVQRREVAREKKEVQYQIIETFVAAGEDIIRNLEQKLREAREALIGKGKQKGMERRCTQAMADCYRQLNELTRYANRHLQEAGRQYKFTPLVLSYTSY